MYKRQKILGLVTARGGSKGLPQKNVLPLLGKPLIGWTIEAGLKSRYIDQLIVSTDSRQIAKVSKGLGAQVPFLRPGHLASDTAKSIDVVLHALDYLNVRGQVFDYVALLEPTSPLRETEDIDRAIRTLIDNPYGALSIVGVSRVTATHPAFDVRINRRGFLTPYLKSFKNLRRQDLDQLYFLEGTVYVSSVAALKERKAFYHDRTLAYIVPKWKSLEVDDFVDFICIEPILSHREEVRKRGCP